MLRIFGGIVTGWLFLAFFPIAMGFFVLMAMVGAPITFLDRTVGLHFLTVPETDMQIVPVSVQWNSTTSKSVTLKVRNLTQYPWSKFTIDCQTDQGGSQIIDLSGILPGENEFRSYTMSYVNMSTINKVWDCKVTEHTRGKPRDFNYYNDFRYEGGGGWGDRLLEEHKMRADSSSITDNNSVYMTDQYNDSVIKD